MNTILPDSDPIRRRLWAIFDQIKRTNTAHRQRLQERGRRIRRRILAQARKAVMQ